MPRTKHLFGIASILGVFLIVCGIRLMIGNDFVSRSVSVPTFSSDTQTLKVVVSQSYAREEHRVSFIERLAERLRNEQVASAVKAESEVNVEDVVEDADETTVVASPYTRSPTIGSVYTCDGSTLSHAPLFRTWGEIEMTRIEGARIFTYNEIIASGTPHSTTLMQVPETPYHAPIPTCLSRDAVGIAHDGTIIYTGTPITIHTTDTDGRIGFALDGFGMYGTIEDGHTITNTDLDACHGHVGTVSHDGAMVDMYHYHVTDTFPYVTGCFAGIPSGQL